MKYKLKKDLPFAKAGEIVTTVEIHPMYSLGYSKGGNGNLTLRLSNQSQIDYLLSEGWIEEVKPREWEVVEYNGFIYSQVDTLQFALCSPQPVYKTVKVREVLE